ncbi:superoxide dismutase family protein [Sporosarcina sp. G11-34]|uniref:superoxide dismutase family protein n=1 Tax=Sporosarcina sp. G11-34 TaxID=2849605 RepID=UPI002E75EF35|nr:superoxide dismutase family protein [Sporosarcina sp. G11-34]
MFIVMFTVSLLLLVTGCGKKGAWLPVSGDISETVAAPILNAEGEKIGEATFDESKDGITIKIIAEGLPPGLHGTHIHEKGECTPPGFESAGAHFNPTHKQHGFDNLKGFHLGDLPNVVVDYDGKVKAKMTTDEFTLKPNLENSILDNDGSALVIHEDMDDYKTDPSGNSGKRIACAAFNQ